MQQNGSLRPPFRAGLALAELKWKLLYSIISINRLLLGYHEVVVAELLLERKQLQRWYGGYGLRQFLPAKQMVISVVSFAGIGYAKGLLNVDWFELPFSVVW